MAEIYDKNTFETGDRRQIRMWFDIEAGPSDEQINLADWVFCWLESAYSRRGDTKTADQCKHARWLLPRSASKFDEIDKEIEKEKTNGNG